MSRIVTIGAAQLGPIDLSESRSHVIGRLVSLMHQARSRGCDVIVFPELALTTFFPRWYFERQEDIDRFFEREMPSSDTRALFDTAVELGIGFQLGYAELVEEMGRTRHYNTAIIVDATGRTVGKYRKIHLPGHIDHEPWRPFQHLEKRYFDVGNLGFGVWRVFGGLFGMCICNDRRWPESYRVMGLQGVEMVMLGYNTPIHNPTAPEHDDLSSFHNQLVMQAGAYQNGAWVVGVAKCGVEEGVAQIGDSQIVAPSGQTIAMATTVSDELIVARCDLDLCRSYKTTIFNFAAHRRPETYRLICEQAGAVPPPDGNTTDSLLSGKIGVNS